jgi:trafficking protein particle complex subunit 12
VSSPLAANSPSDQASAPPTPLSQSQSAISPTESTTSHASISSQLLNQDTISKPLKDFSFLLRPEIYHPLTQLEIPAPFRTPALQPSPSTPLPTLLSTGNFRAAAILSAHLLTTSAQPHDHVTIFDLLYTRLATLTLINATQLAAQEVRALDDLNSGFYRDENTGSSIVPWDLRVLAVRLQGLGTGEWRRGIMGLYELGRECRLEAEKHKSEPEERLMWEGRLSDLGIRVANALLEMSEVDGAVRHLDSLRSGLKADSQRKEERDMRSRLSLLYLRMGNVNAAKECVDWKSADSDEVALGGTLGALVAMAEGNYGDAVEEWKSLLEVEAEGSGGGKGVEMMKQNLAVCLIYLGQLAEVRSSLLESVGTGSMISYI